MIGSTALASQVMVYEVPVLAFFADPRFPVVPETTADELPREDFHQIPAYARQSLFQQHSGQLSERR